MLDGWLALLYLIAFVSIAFLWRPSTNNRRYVSYPFFSCYAYLFCPSCTLAMSDEIAQDEEDAEDYDLEALDHRTRVRDDDDDVTLVGDRPGVADVRHNGQPHASDVVFEIGDEEPGSDGEEDNSTKRRRPSGEGHYGEEHERQGLIGTGQTRTRDD